VVDGRYRLTYVPKDKVAVESWLRPQKRFAHLLRPENAETLAAIQRRIDEDWAAVLARCAG
jgi:pyruvate ferredoxin oxidoreductase beta subunit